MHSDVVYEDEVVSTAWNDKDRNSKSDEEDRQGGKDGGYDKEKHENAALMLEDDLFGELETEEKVDEEPGARFHRAVDAIDKCSPVKVLIWLRLKLETLYRRHCRRIRFIVVIILILGYFTYLGFALQYKFGDEESIRLVVITILIVIGYLYHVIKKYYGKKIVIGCLVPLCSKLDKIPLWRECRPKTQKSSLIPLLSTVLLTVALLGFILVDTIFRRPRSLISALGILVLILLVFFFSKNPRQVTWRPVLWGLLLQIIFGLVVLRTWWGYHVFDWLGERVTEYLNHADAGASFIFGKDFKEHQFAFQVLPVLVFFSASISILYYLGWIQALIEKIAFVMQYSLGTDAMESLHAAFNIFIGWGEALVIVRPMLDQMTMSELHTIMTNGFATVAGSTLAIYILYGAPANHLLSASVMSAPAALAISKLFYPENPDLKRDKRQEYELPRSGSGLIEAASIGAIGAIAIVSHILASVIAFISFLAFVNASLNWFGERVGLVPPDYPSLSFELICSYLFWPLAFIMGVSTEDCRIVARMVGIKTFVNEFIAYEDLGVVKNNRFILASFNGTWHMDKASNIMLEGTNITLVGGVISPHSEMIATYALCGFSNVVALGIMIGALTAVAPSRKDDIVSVSMRALLSGCVACFMTACVAGLLGDS